MYKNVRMMEENLFTIGEGILLGMNKACECIKKCYMILRYFFENASSDIALHRLLIFLFLSTNVSLRGTYLS